MAITESYPCEMVQTLEQLFRHDDIPIGLSGKCVCLAQKFILVMFRLTFEVVDENAILRLLSVSVIIQFLSTRITKN